MIEKRVSIIVPVYNIEKYLEKCIESILSQSYGNFELLLIDDGSTDGSGALCDKYREKDGRISVRHQSNRGSGDARNQGLTKCTGDYIMFADGDDYINEDTLETLVRTMEKENADCILFGMDTVNEKGKVLSKSLDFTPYTTDRKEKMLEVIFCDPYKSFPFSSCTKFFKRDVLKNARYEAGKAYEDNYFLYEWLNAVHRMTVLPDRLYHYLCHDGSNIRKKKYDNHILDVIDASKINYLLTEKNYPEARVWAKYNYVYSYHQALVAVLKCEDWENQLRTIKVLQKEMRKHAFFFVRMGREARKAASYLLLCVSFKLYRKIKTMGKLKTALY